MRVNFEEMKCPACGSVFLPRQSEKASGIRTLFLVNGGGFLCQSFEMCKSFADARNTWTGYRDLRVINNPNKTESLPLRSSAVDM